MTNNPQNYGTVIETNLEIKECEKSVAKVEEEKKEEDKSLKDLLEK